MTLYVRPAVSGDARLLWEWRNDPVVRANSFNSDPIPWKDHEAWYTMKLASAETRIFILEDDQEGPLGQVRFERRTSEVAEVNLAVAACARGLGYGQEMLTRALPLAHAALGVERFEALVKRENMLSFLLFRATGFEIEGELTVAGCPSVKLARPWPAHP